MKWAAFLALWISAVSCKSEISGGFLDRFINATLESLRPKLVDVHIKGQNFETGPQEIGNLKGNLTKVTVEGLEKFIVKTLKTSFLNINNLTIVEEEINANGFYKINGTLAFPLGRNDIHLFGDGEFRAKFQNFSVSLKVKIRLKDGIKVADDLDLFVGLEGMQIYLKNLMGDSELEEVFNGYLNNVGLTVFNYYKGPILDLVKPKLKDIITELLNKLSDEENSKEEL